MTPLFTPVLVLAGIGLVMAALLAVGRKLFYVHVDERLEKIADILPGANCGGCGFPGCSGYAAALVKGDTSPNACPPGGADLAEEIGGILGVTVEATTPEVAVVACAGDNQTAPIRVEYVGIPDCTAAHNIAGGTKRCNYGCLGFGSCVGACPFDAIVMTEQGLAVVLPDLCTGCGNCVAACPRQIIKMVPKSQQVHVLCTNPLKAKAVKAACQVGCTGCKLCLKQSARFEMTQGLAAVNNDETTEIPPTASLVCPQGAIADSRKHPLVLWITEPDRRKQHEADAAAWKEAEKARKAAAKAKKQAKKKEKDSA